MTKLLNQAIDEVSKLSPERQDYLASILMEELESEQRWEELLARPESQKLMEQMATEALEELRAGKTQAIENCCPTSARM